MTVAEAQREHAQQKPAAQPKGRTRKAEDISPDTGSVSAQRSSQEPPRLAVFVNGQHSTYHVRKGAVGPAWFVSVENRE